MCAILRCQMSFVNIFKMFLLSHKIAQFFCVNPFDLTTVFEQQHEFK